MGAQRAGFGVGEETVDAAGDVAELKGDGGKARG